MNKTTLEIGLLFFPGMTQLDVTGPFEVLARLPGARMHLLWKSIEPITSDVGLTLIPTTTFADCPQLDVLCVGGGPGQMALMDDAEVMAFVAKAGANARYVTSVCAGCFILAGPGCSTATSPRAIGCRAISTQSSVPSRSRNASWWIATASRAAA